MYPRAIVVREICNSAFKILNSKAFASVRMSRYSIFGSYYIAAGISDRSKRWFTRTYGYNSSLQTGNWQLIFGSCVFCRLLFYVSPRLRTYLFIMFLQIKAKWLTQNRWKSLKWCVWSQTCRMDSRLLHYLMQLSV